MHPSPCSYITHEIAETRLSVFRRARDVEKIEFVKNKRQTLQQKGGAMKKFLATDTFEPTNGGTKWTNIVEYELPYSLLGKIIDNLKVRKDMKKSSRLLCEQDERAHRKGS